MTNKHTGIDLNSQFSILRLAIGFIIGTSFTVYFLYSFLQNQQLIEFFIFIIPSVFFVKKLKDLILDVVSSDIEIVKGKISSIVYIGNGYQTVISFKINKLNFKLRYAISDNGLHKKLKNIRGGCQLSFYTRTKIPISIKY